MRFKDDIHSPGCKYMPAGQPLIGMELTERDFCY